MEAEEGKPGQDKERQQYHEKIQGPDPEDPADLEIQNMDLPVPLLFFQDQVGDEEAADREEEKYAQMAEHFPVQEGRHGNSQGQLSANDVADDHQAGGDEAQPVQIRKIGFAGPCHSGRNYLH